MPDNDEPQELTYDEAVALLPDEDQIHTIIDAGGIRLGADWDRADILDLLRTSPHRDVTGPAAQSIGHGLAAANADGRLIFIETKD